MLRKAVICGLLPSCRASIPRRGIFMSGFIKGREEVRLGSRGIMCLVVGITVASAGTEEELLAN